MQLGNFTPGQSGQSDTLKASDIVDEPLIVAVREHRTGIVTQFKPEGAEVITVDVAKISTDSTFIDVGWFNIGIVNDLRGHLGEYLPVKLAYKQTKSGRTAIVVNPLEGMELQAAIKWAEKNPTRLDDERADRFGGPTPQQEAPAAAKPAADADRVAQLQALIDG